MRTVPDSQPFRLPPGAVWSAPRTLKLPTRNPVAGVVCGTVLVRAAAGVAAGSAAAAGPASGAAGATSRAVASVRPTAQRRRREDGREEAVVPGMEGPHRCRGSGVVEVTRP